METLEKKGVKGVSKRGNYWWLKEQNISEMPLKNFITDVVHPILEYASSKSFSSELKNTFRKIHADNLLNELFTEKMDEFDKQDKPYDTQVVCARMVAKFHSCAPKGTNMKYPTFMELMRGIC